MNKRIRKKIHKRHVEASKQSECRGARYTTDFNEILMALDCYMLLVRLMNCTREGPYTIRNIKRAVKSSKSKKRPMKENSND